MILFFGDITEVLVDGVLKSGVFINGFLKGVIETFTVITLSFIKRFKKLKH